MKFDLKQRDARAVLSGELLCNIKELTPEKPIHSAIMAGIRNTHAQHHNFKVHVKGIFEIEKPSQKLAYLPFEKKLHNKFLLWAGVKPSSVLTTMRDGLLIPAQESSVGLMFGRGIYLADSFSKAANLSCS